jgi:hypothetical protein
VGRRGTTDADAHCGTRPRRVQLLACEPVFGLFLLAAWLRVGLARGFLQPLARPYPALLLVGAGLVLWSTLRPTEILWRLRLAFYSAAMAIAYLEMGRALEAIPATLWDQRLARIDTWVFGATLAFRLQAWVHPVATDVLSLAYMLYIPYMGTGLLRYWLNELGTAKRFFTGVIGLYGVGLMGYLLMPARGPYLAMAEQFGVPLRGGSLTNWNAVMVQLGSNHVDVFPSLHCAVSAFVLFFDRRHSPRLFLLCLVPCAALWVATLYLRYHYLVDVLVGFALSAVAYRVATGAMTSTGPE